MRPVELQSTKPGSVMEHTIQRKTLRGAIIYLLIGLTSTFIGILSVLYDFQQLALIERIKVRPGLPPYELWKDASAIGVDIGFKMYLFDVENPDEFLSNATVKLKLKEIGPIIYKKVMHQDDIIFHKENSTMSFSTVFDLVLDEERTETGILNKSITIVNPMLLAMAATASDIFLARMAFKLIAINDHVFLNRTVYEVLWNNSSPVFDFVKEIPFATPTDNAGIMFNGFSTTIHRYNVNIGPKHGFKNFFKINTYNGLSWIDAFDENFPKHCPYSIKGSTEGTGLPPHIGKDDIIYAYTKNLCRTYPMIYNATLMVDGIEAYKYMLADEVYTRLENPELDCLKKTGNVMLPNGLSDSSKCAWGIPAAVSNPHFWGYNGDWENYLEGLNPDTDKHASYVYVEPTSGIQLEAIARIQSNLPLPNLHSFSGNISRFSGMIIPTFWMEYFVVNRVPVIHALIVLFLSLPIIQYVFVIAVLVSIIFSFYKSYRLMIRLSKLKKLPEGQEVIFEQQPLCNGK